MYHPREASERFLYDQFAHYPHDFGFRGDHHRGEHHGYHHQRYQHHPYSHDVDYYQNNLNNSLGKKRGAKQPNKKSKPAANSQEDNNKKPVVTSTDNVLEDEDPAICFVKAYARKPLGVPHKNVASNSMDRYWYDDDEDEENSEDFEDDNYMDNYDEFSDSEDYYGEE